MATARRRGGVAVAIVGLAAAALAASACGPSDPGGGVARPAPDDDPGQPAPPARTDPSARTAPEGPRAATRWVRILDPDVEVGFHASVRVAAAPDGAFVAVTRGSGDPLRRLTVQRIDAAGVVRWKTSHVPSCEVSVEPLRVSPAGEVFIGTKAWCDDPLPGLWPLPLGGSVVVLDEDGTFRRRVAIGADWYFAEIGAEGGIWTAEDREQGGFLTFRKRDADGAVLWEKRDVLGTKRPFSLVVAPDGGAYLHRDAGLMRLHADGTLAWEAGLGVHGETAFLTALDDGGVAAAGHDLDGVRGSGATCDPPAVVVVEGDGARRGKTRVPGCFGYHVASLRGGGVTVLTSDGAYPGPSCRWIEALGPDLRTRWARRVEETCQPDAVYRVVGDPAAGTLGVGGVVAARADFGEGAVVLPEPGKSAAVLVSIDAAAGAAGEPPPSGP